MAKKKGCLFKIGIALLIFIGMIFVLFCMVLIMPSEEYETVNYDIPNMCDYYTHIKGNGEDKVTLMAVSYTHLVYFGYRTYDICVHSLSRTSIKI